MEDFGLVRDFAITMAVAGGALVLFRFLKQPPVLGYLLAGVIIGPFTLPNPPVKDVDTIRLMADLGLVLLLFGIGLEFGWQRIRRVGSRVIIIALVEMTIMFVLGYEIGILLGWTGLESVFLGSALSISSSAILVKMLRDTGSLFATRGRLIVGILVVEDFVAVILLTVLSGISSTGSTDPGAIGMLAAKLIIFAVAALVFGAIIAPRLIRFVERFHSDETLLISSLALCFGLALAGQQLGLSAAAGAFLIGTVLGDTEHAEEISRVMNPVRDMFAALFFVSIGMLMDVSQFADFLVPALIISVVFILGKVVADTLGTFLAGYDGRTSLTVGMGMPQIGEFSLAMTKMGVEQGAVGAFLNPVVTVATAVTALAYPFIYRSAHGLADLLNRRSPAVLKDYGEYLFFWVAMLRSSFQFHSPHARRIQHSVRLLLLNLGIIVLLIAIGTGLLQFTGPLAGIIRMQESLLGLIIGGAVVALCVPPAIAIWLSLRRLTDGIADYVLPGQRSGSSTNLRRNLRVVLRDSILIVIVVLPVIWGIPFIFSLFSLGILAAPVPILILTGVIAGLTLAAFQIHRVLESTFSRTFLGIDDPRHGENDDLHFVDDDAQLHSADMLDPERFPSED
ncbi:MAG: cation:proton antiporter [Chloroflexi bacterium]|nr:cation:proton antiporter [Chloroflexota bacterium]